MYIIHWRTTKLLQGPQIYISQEIFHSNTPACNGHYETEILLCWKCQNSIPLASVTPKSAIKFTTIYSSPEYYDHFLNHSKKPHVSHRAGENFPLHMKQLNAGALGRYLNNIFDTSLMTIK
jgi:hypothetical protein